MNQYEVNDETLDYATIKPILKKYWKLSDVEIRKNIVEIMEELYDVSGGETLDNVAVWFVARAGCGCLLSTIILQWLATPNPRREL